MEKARIIPAVYGSLYVVSVIFILSGAFNYGFSRFVMAVPFMLAAAFIAKNKRKSQKMFAGTLAFCALAIVINLTLEKNPFVFPIVNEGYVTINKDGYVKTYSDGSGGFSAQDKEEFMCTGCGNVTYRRVLKGEKYKVTGVNVTYPDFGTNIDLMTEVGPFSVYDYRPLRVAGSEENIITSKPVENPFFKNAGILMIYPVAPIYLSALFKRALPGVDVLVEDDAGRVRNGTLSRIVTSGRPVKTGEKVRLNCTKASSFKDRKYCELEFSGFDPSSPHRKGSPLYGKIPSFGISVDSSGIPDKSILVFR